MPFTEPAFLFFFLPATLAAYFLFPERARNLLLTAASLLFYAVGEWRFVPWLLGSTMATYLVARGLEAWRGRPVTRALLALGVVTDLGLLAWFKYAGFLARAVDGLTGLLGAPLLPVPTVLLPLGISFFTFHKISYKVDVYRGTAAVRKNPLDLLLYILFFPQLIAGPIVRYHDIADDLVRRHPRLADVAEGVRRFGVGLAKKMLVANTMAGVADVVFALEPARLSTPAAWVGIVCYTLQIYFDFSGYSDMAIGLARMFGFRFLENFDYPYTARSITDFWRRWHLSLSRWFRDYLYLPLGGNRSGPVRTYLNLGVVFLLCGLWHGASWTFVAWGAFHGALLILERAGWGPRLQRLPAGLQHAQTLLLVMLGWVLFRADTLAHGGWYLRALAGFGANDGPFETLSLLTPGVALALTAGVVGSAPTVGQLAQDWRKRLGARAELVLGWAGNGAVLALLLLSVLQVASGTYNPFIYFRF
ncbi:MAG TPA: MBOAT family protein [Myxococcaceae bacterium]|nr:MBOAT family protein [Myxococcaceae bacterium]